MANEQFCLKWNDFETNVSTAFRELREDKDFFDVTIACDDEQIQAHKVILAACSTFFRTVLRRNRHEHPLLYLKGVKYIDLVAVLNFMYHGEVNVAQEQLNDFLSIAEELKVKGLTQTQNKNVPKDNTPSYNTPEVTNVTKKEPPNRPETESRPVKRIRQEDNTQTQKTYSVQRNNNDDDEIQEVVAVKAEPLSSSMHENTMEGPSNTYGLNNSNTVAIDQNQMEPMYDDSYNEYENYEDAGEGYDGALIDPNEILSQANADNKASKPKFVQRKHSPKFQKPKQWENSPSYDYACSKTDFYDGYEGTETIEQTSEEMSYASFPCEHCDYVATHGHNLKKHIEAKHLGVTYSCELCPYEATQKQNLKRHLKLKHSIQH